MPTKEELEAKRKWQEEKELFKNLFSASSDLTDLSKRLATELLRIWAEKPEGKQKKLQELAKEASQTSFKLLNLAKKIAPQPGQRAPLIYKDYKPTDGLLTLQDHYEKRN